MGVAVAEAALDRGARVTLVAANTEVPLPAGAMVVRVESTADLRAALLHLTHAGAHVAGFDALVMAAAIANEFSEAATDMHFSALAYVALVLFAITVVVNALARLLIWRVSKGQAAGGHGG